MEFCLLIPNLGSKVVNSVVNTLNNKSPLNYGRLNLDITLPVGPVLIFTIISEKILQILNNFVNIGLKWLIYSGYQKRNEIPTMIHDFFRQLYILILKSVL